MKKELDETKIYFANIPGDTLGDLLQRLTNEAIIERAFRRDYTVWGKEPAEIENRLGWTTSHERMPATLPEIRGFVESIRAEGFTRALLLGMGGSSLAPEVFRRIFGVEQGYLDLDVLDSTDPDLVRAKQEKIGADKTLFIVSTKSGGTVETISLMNYFFTQTARREGRERAGSRFIAITDPKSGLEDMAKALDFRKIFLNDSEIGGRYSALSYFGLVPAALIGIDPEIILAGAGASARSLQSKTAAEYEENRAVKLGLALGALEKRGQDKVTLVFSPSLEPFGAWIEQLVAESTGKEGRGLLPIDGEEPMAPERYAKDRLFVYTRLAGENRHDRKMTGLVEAGFPVIRIDLPDRSSLGGEFFCWMTATALAGWALGINPFDQPNVEAAKDLARHMVSAYRGNNELPSLQPDLREDTITVYAGFPAATLQEALHRFLALPIKESAADAEADYIAIQAYLKPCPANDAALQNFRNALQKKTKRAVTTGYGPRYLHSTGQLHKGDAGRGLFIQLSADPTADLPVPDQPGEESASISFGLLKKAQCLGDRQALIDTGRNVILFHFAGDAAAALGKLTAAINLDR